MELFKLLGTIAIDTSGVDSAVSTVKSKMESLGEKIESVGSKVSGIGTKLTLGVTTPLTFLGKSAITTAADFESAMSEVGAISGATGADFKALEEKAKEMGRTTKFSASESAEALKYMAMAGWKTEDMLNGLEGIMNLAAASGEDLGMTSDIVTDSLTAFGLSASDSGHFADLLAKASSNANTNVSMMGETFKYVAPVAGAMGFSAEDTALAIGLMANSGIKASQAGTALRSSLTNLADPTKEMQSVMVSLGLATQETANVIDDGKLQKAQTKVENKTIDMEKAQIKYNDAVKKYGVNSSQAQTAALNLEKAQNNLQSAVTELNAAQEGSIETTGIQNNLLVDSAGNTRSLREVMVTLRESFKGLSTEQQTQAAATLFGKEAMSGMLAIINASEADFNKLVDAIDSADGAAKDMADTMNDNLNGQITLLKSQLQDLAIQFVTLIMPYLRQGVEWLSKLCTWIAGLDDNTKKMIITVAGIAAAAGPVLVIGGKVISGVGKIISGVSGIVSIIGKLSPAISGIISIGGKLVGGIGSLIAKVGSGLLPALASIPTPVWAVIAVLGALVAAGVAIYKNWDEIKEFGSKIWSAIKDFVGNAVEGIMGFFSNIVDFISNNWQGLLTFIVNPFVGGFKLLYDNCETFRNFIDGFLNNLKEGFQNFKDNISEKFTELKENITEKAHEMKEKVSEKFSEMKESVVSKVEELKSGAIEKISDLKERAHEKVSEMKEAVVSKVEEMKENAASKIYEMSEKISSGFQEMKDRAAEKFSDLKEKWTSKFTEAKEKMISEATEMKEKVGGKLEEFKTDAVEKIESLKTNAVQKFHELKDAAGAKISELSQKGIEGFNSIKEKGGAAISSLKDFAISKFHEMGEAASSKFTTVANSIANIFDKTKEKVHSIVEAIKGFSNFEWKLPDIKLPHFNIDGEFSLNPPSIPHFGVEWYANGGVLTDPTAFGFNPYSGNVMVGGEAGEEAIAPVDILKAYVREAVADSNLKLYDVLNAILALLQKYIPDMANKQLVLNTGALVGEIAEPMNEELGKIAYMRGRRN